MKVITIMGSPKKKGKTATALEMLEKDIVAQGHEVERINIIDYKVNCCIECLACMSKTDEPGCVQKDDALLIFEKIISADVVVFASPLYSFGFTAQLKPLIDRYFCLSNTSLMDGKRMILLITCAGKEEGNADLVQEFFSRAFDGQHGAMYNTNLIGKYVIPLSGEPDFNERAQEVANTINTAILSAF